jgi:hypothetical protein
MDALQPSPLPAGPDPFEPFWSPDGRSIGYFSRGQLRRYDIAGGSDQAICAVPANYGGAWNREGVILIGGEGLFVATTWTGWRGRGCNADLEWAAVVCGSCHSHIRTERNQHSPARSFDCIALTTAPRLPHAPGPGRPMHAGTNGSGRRRAR